MKTELKPVQRLDKRGGRLNHQFEIQTTIFVPSGKVTANLDNFPNYADDDMLIGLRPSTASTK